MAVLYRPLVRLAPPIDTLSVVEQKLKAAHEKRDKDAAGVEKKEKGKTKPC